MGKKKIIGLCLAVGLMVGVVGGSLAWFTDTDSVTNSFATEGNQPGKDNGIKVDEDFDKETAGSMLPGTEVTKEVRVQNNATYDQYMRVKLTKVWKDEAGNTITKIWVKGNERVAANTEGAKEVDLNNGFIQLNFGKNIGEGTNKWTDKTNDKNEKTKGYYYYNSSVAPGGKTNNLLESVTLSPEAGNIYKGLKFDVVVDAQGIQASNGAAADAWGYTPESTK